jgi:hypothetical protein
MREVMGCEDRSEEYCKGRREEEWKEWKELSEEDRRV